MTTLEIRQVDAFTTEPFGGNPAGVVLDAAPLSDAQMQIIAREMNVSETAFLLPPSRPGADFRIRWFTPTVEVDLCGHGTVACLHAAMEEGRLEPGAYRMECLAGVLPVELVRGEGGGPVVRLGLPAPDLVEWNIAGCRLTDALGLDPDDLARGLAVMRSGRWGVVPLSGLAALRRARPDIPAVRELEAAEGIGELIALTTETMDAGSAVHLRMFAPACGIDEDPVTGAAQGPVAAFLARHALLVPAPDGSARYVAEQGDVMARPGRVQVDLTIDGGRASSITISGRAVTVMTGRLYLRV